MIKLGSMTWEQYMRSEEWRVLKARCIARDGQRCVCCNRVGKLTAHHRHYPVDPVLDHLGNLTTLCPRCHIVISRAMGHGKRKS